VRPLQAVVAISLSLRDRHVAALLAMTGRREPEGRGDLVPPGRSAVVASPKGVAISFRLAEAVSLRDRHVASLLAMTGRCEVATSLCCSMTAVLRVTPEREYFIAHSPESR